MVAEGAAAMMMSGDDVEADEVVSQIPSMTTQRMVS